MRKGGGGGGSNSIVCMCGLFDKLFDRLKRANADIVMLLIETSRAFRTLDTI